MTLRIKSKFLTLFTASLGCAAAYAAPILYETFDYYGDYVENFANGTSVIEHSGSVKNLYITPEKPNTLVFKKPLTIPANRQASNFKYTFQVSFEDEKRDVTAHMIFAQKTADGKIKANRNIQAVIDWEKSSLFRGSTLAGFSNMYMNNR